jgi:hypothetical protein
MANCPICNKPDIGDYTNEHVVCPQCNSNLKGFMLFSLSQKRVNVTIKRLYFSFAILFFLILSIVAFSFFHNNNAINISSAACYVKSDTIKYYQGIIYKLNQDHQSDLENLSMIYIVKPGDNLSKIAHFFYNDWEKYKMIEQENNLAPNHILLPNEKLKISLKFQQWSHLSF